MTQNRSDCKQYVGKNERMVMRTKTDAELINAYAETNDQSAFAEIVSRHGSMVYRACFRTLMNRQDAEDASQAVFMALIKKSNRIKWKASLACWLFAVARQTALFAARTRVHREQRENAAAEIMDAESHPLISKDDQDLVLRFLNEELSALSTVQREAVILRYLDGLGEKEASEIAGCSYNAFRSRVNDGINHLRQRMVRRGCALGIPALIGAIGAESQAAVPQTLIPSLLAVPKLVAAGATAGTASANIIFLMEGALKTMAITKIKTAGIGILIALLIGTSGVVAVKEIQKRQKSDVNEKSSIVNSNEKEKIPSQAELSKNDELALASKEVKQKDKPPTAKVKQPPKARNFQTEAENALKENDFVIFCNVLQEWFAKDQYAAALWGETNIAKSQIIAIASIWAQKDPLVHCIF